MRGASKSCRPMRPIYVGAAHRNCAYATPDFDFAEYLAGKTIDTWKQADEADVTWGGNGWTCVKSRMPGLERRHRCEVGCEARDLRVRLP